MGRLNQKILPIFPLDLVLFPRQELPLRIFEPRYKQLVDDCMVGDGQFGVCLIEQNRFVGGWNAPKQIGTVAKILSCQDIEPDGIQLHIETVGRNKFKINKIIGPSFEQPPDYDPYTIQGHKVIEEMHEKAGTAEKMYISAQVDMIPEIDDDVPILQWEELVSMWKNKIVTQALPRKIDPHSLDHMLEQYYLATEVPTVDYVYSLSALGAQEPEDLQTVLESDSMGSLLQNVKELMTIK